ncbi:MAG: hypothetical protein ABSB75_02960 [Candidatus Limnocylindrales bacterium]
MNEQDIDVRLNELARADRSIRAPERLRDLMRALEAGEPTPRSRPRAVVMRLLPLRGRPIGLVWALGIAAMLTLVVVSLPWLMGARTNGGAPSPALTPPLAQLQQSALLKFYADDRQYANDEHVHEMDCFPTTVGASQQAEITQTIATSPLTVPLPVTCTVVSMVPYPLPGWNPPKYGWTVTLSQSWVAGPDYPAGYATYRFNLEPDGSVIGGGFVAGSGPTPEGKSGPLPYYPHVGTSKYHG